MCDLCYVLCGYVCMCLCSTCMSAMYVVCLCVICVCALCCVCIYTMYCVVCGGWMCVSLSCLARSSMRWEITKGYFTKQMGFPNLFLALWHLHLSLFSSDHKGLCVILVRSGLPGWEAEKVLPGAEQWGFGTHKGGGVVPSLWSEFWDPRPWSDENHLKRACEVIAPPPPAPTLCLLLLLEKVYLLCWPTSRRRWVGSWWRKNCRGAFEFPLAIFKTPDCLRVFI